MSCCSHRQLLCNVFVMAARYVASHLINAKCRHETQYVAITAETVPIRKHIPSKPLLNAQHFCRTEVSVWEHGGRTLLQTLHCGSTPVWREIKWKVRPSMQCELGVGSGSIGPRGQYGQPHDPPKGCATMNFSLTTSSLMNLIVFQCQALHQ
jgi:hypothetical protein